MHRNQPRVGIFFTHADQESNNQTVILNLFQKSFPTRICSEKDIYSLPNQELVDIIIINQTYTTPAIRDYQIGRLINYLKKIHVPYLSIYIIERGIDAHTVIGRSGKKRGDVILLSEKKLKNLSEALVKKIIFVAKNPFSQ